MAGKAWKKKLQVAQFGVSQMRVLTITDSAKRVERMLQVVGEMTAGKGSNFFLFAHNAERKSASPLELSFITGKREPLRLID
jgi:hypothetical protein